MAPLDLESIVRRPEIQAILRERLGARRQMRTNRNWMRANTEELLELVRAAQGR